MLAITDQFLTADICRPLFKALHFQSNLNTIDLTNSFIEDDGLKHLAQALPTLAQLSVLNLSGNLITLAGIRHIESVCDTNQNCLVELKELYLSFNPLQNQSILPLSNLCSRMTELRTLHLESTELTHLKEFDLSFGSLCDLNVSHNTFGYNGLTKAIDKLNACKLIRLNLSYCRPLNDDADDDDVSRYDTKLLVESLIKVLNAGTCSNLEEIHLSGWGLTDVDCWRLIQPIGRSKMLRHISLTDNLQLTKVTLKHLFESVSVKHLHLGGCRSILNGLNENDAECLQCANCMESVTISLTNNCTDSDEITALKRFWGRATRGRGKLFVKGTTSLMLLKSDAYNKIWGHSLC